MQLLKIFFLFFIFCNCIFTYSQTLSLSNYNSFITQLKVEYPLIKSANNLSNIGKANKMAAKGMYDTYLSGDIINKFYGGKNYYTVGNAEAIQQLFTGQYLKAGYEYGQGSLLNPEETRPTYGLAYVGIEASLLQGLVIDKNRFEFLKSIQYEKILNNEKQINTNDILFLASTNYVSWLKEYELLKLNQAFAIQALTRYIALKSAADIGERPAIDTIEASILYQTRNIETNNSKLNFNKVNAQINTIIWQADENTLITQFPLEIIQNLFLLSTKNSIDIKLINAATNPFVDYYNNKLNLLKTEKRFKIEMLKPKLDVKYNFLGYSTNENSFAAQLSPNNYNWGAKFTMPILLRTARNELKATNFNIKNANNDLITKTAELQNKIEAAKTNLSIFLQQYTNAKQMAINTKTLFEAEKLKFENGESTLFLLNTRENKIIEAETKLIESQAKYLDNYFYIIYLQGTLNYTL